MNNRMKRKMEQGEKVLGTFFEMGGTTAVECIGLSGLDFFIIDTEHGPFDVESAKEYIIAAQNYEATPLVRVKDGSRASILKMLDVGAQGLIIPCINSVNEVKKIVEYGKYFPLGQRGFAPARSAGYGFRDFAKNINSYFETCNCETMLIPQCETLGCLEKIEEVTAIEGVDGIFIGPYDLSVAMGKPAEFDDPEFLSAVKRILTACKSAGKFALIYTGSRTLAETYYQDGFDAVAFNMDTIMYINAFKELIKEVKGEDAK